MISRQSALADAAQHVGKFVARVAADDSLRTGVVKGLGTRPTPHVVATFVIEWRQPNDSTTDEICEFAVLKPALVLGGIIEAQRAIAAREAVASASWRRM